VAARTWLRLSLYSPARRADPACCARPDGRARAGRSGGLGGGSQVEGASWTVGGVTIHLPGSALDRWFSAGCVDVDWLEATPAYRILFGTQCFTGFVAVFGAEAPESCLFAVVDVFVFSGP
jgi:hypothetical protein